MNIPHSDALVFFGATGDLIYKKIFPALYAMERRGHLQVPVIGVARSDWTIEQFRARARESVEKNGGFDGAVFAKLQERLRYISGALAAAWVFKKNKVPLAGGADMSAPALALGYGIERIGCFLAGDATWGKVSDVAWAMAFSNAMAGWANPLTGVPYPPGVRVHPTQIYELVQSLVVFVLLWSLRKRHFPPGTIFYLYLVLAGSMRFIVEFWRVNPVIGFGLTEYQWISLALIIVGTGLLCHQWKPEQIKQSIKRT